MVSGASVLETSGRERVCHKMGPRPSSPITALPLSGPQGPSVRTIGNEVPPTGCGREGLGPTLFPLINLCGAQEQWGISYDSQFVSPQQVYRHAQVQIGNYSDLEEVNSRGSLDGQARLARRLPACSGPPKVQEVPGLFLQGRALLFQCPPIRPLPSSLHFLQDSELPNQTLEGRGSECIGLLGRPHTLGEIQVGGEKGVAISSEDLLKSRIFDKLEKIGQSADAKASLARFFMEDTHLFHLLAQRVSSTGEATDYQGSGVCINLPKGVRKPSGTDGLRGAGDPESKVQRTSVTETSQEVQQWKGQIVTPQTKTPSGSEMVDPAYQLVSVSSNKKQSSIHANMVGRIGNWVRSTQRFWKIYSRKLVRSTYSISYKCQRTFGNISGLRVQSSSRRRFRCHIYRQQGRVLHGKKQGFKSFRDSTRRVRSSSGSDREEEPINSPGLPERGEKCDGRCSVPGQSDSFGVESDSSLFSGFSPVHRLETADRPYGDAGEHQVARLCLPIPGEGGESHGFLLTKPESVDKCVRLPSPEEPVEVPNETAAFQRKSGAHCTGAALPAMVSDLEGQGLSSPEHFRTSLPDGAGEESGHVLERILETSRLDFIREAYRGRYGIKVANRLVSAYRSSSLNNFESNWKAFQNYLRTERVTHVTLSIVLDFLEYLFSVKKFCMGTIKGYKNALVEPLKWECGIEFPEDIVSKLFRAQFLARPKKAKLVPNWNINPVLQKLKEERFRNEDCALEDLLTKVLFLLLTATGNRASEMAAIQRDTIMFRPQDREVLLCVRPNFLYKNQTERRAPPNIVVKKFEDVDPELCPVACLREYLKRTKDKAAGSALFVHPVTGNNLQRPSIAYRVVQLIEECCPGSFPKCHDLRKHAASLAWSRGLDPSDIVGAVFWSSSDVFIRHYLFVPQVPDLSCNALNTI